MNRDIEELLPFYVNGTLDDADRTRVEQALDENPELQEELKYLKGLKRQVEEKDFVNSPGEFGLKRLQRELREQKNNLSRAPNFSSKSLSSAPRGHKGWQTWRFAAIAACLVLLVQTFLVYPQWQYGTDLVSAGGGIGVHVRGPILSVTFVPQASEENIRNLLLAVDAQIVEGPSALGVYKLSVQGDIDSAVVRLRAHANLIETVQKDGGKREGQ